MSYMVRSLIDKKEKDNLQILFEALDENKDGEINLKEFVSGFKSKFSISVSETEAAKIIRQIDLNNDREVQFTEFLIGASNKNNLLSESNLTLAFSWIDFNKDAFITREDLKEFLGGVKDDTYVGIMIEEADDDCDGGLNLKEF